MKRRERKKMIKQEEGHGYKTRRKENFFKLEKSKGCVFPLWQ